MTQTASQPARTGSPEVLIAARNLSKCYRMGKNEIYALRDVNVEIFRGEYLSVMGPSGSGKSTLFNMIGALDHPSGGTVTIGGVDLTSLTSRQRAYFRNAHIGYIFQAYNLIHSLTALYNVMLPLLFSGKSDAEAQAQATAVLEEVGLGHRLHHRPDEMSGGQQQRVAIARGLANEPSIMLADEPTANLDLHTGEEIIKLLRELCDHHGVTVITATHDHKMLDKSDRILWIKDGKVDRLERRENLDIRVGSVVENKPLDVRDFLDGLRFPARRGDIVAHLQARKAPDYLVGSAKLLTGEQYASAQAVADALAGQ